MIIVIHNVRSTHNVGSIFRTADAAGVTQVILTGYTPTPTDRFGRKRKDIAKTALGAEDTIPWTHYSTLAEAVRVLRAGGYTVFAIEQDSESLTYTEPHYDQLTTAFICGNETEGLTQEECALADTIVEIPMHGVKESLNVAVAVGIVLFEARRGSV